MKSYFMCSILFVFCNILYNILKDSVHKMFVYNEPLKSKDVTITEYM